MKLTRLLLALLISFLISENVKSQDTSIVNYFPMNVGNVWVYYCSAYGNYCYCSKYMRYKITGSLIANGRRYYLFQYSERVPGIPCNGGFCAPNITLDTNRIDSVSGKVLKYSQPGCSYSPYEIMQDSLRARKNDSVRANCSQTRFACMDTGMTTIFGYTRQYKSFGENLFEAQWRKTYVRGFGITGSYLSSVGCNSGTSLRGCVINGVVYGDTTFLVGINQISTEIPDDFSLSRNYPNPFNASTVFSFQLPVSGFVTLKVYDILGRDVLTLVNEQLKPGTYSVDWDASNFPSGIYFYTLTVGDYSEAKKMILIK